MAISPETVHARELADRWIPIEDEDRADLHAWVVAKVKAITAENAWAEGCYREHVVLRVGSVLWPWSDMSRMKRNQRSSELIEEAKAWPT